MRTLIFLVAVCSAYAESRFPFTMAQRAQAVAVLDMSSPGSDWAVKGSEAAIVDVSLDGKPHQQVVLFAGPARHAYRLSLGLLTPGEHEITVERNDRFSAPQAQFEAHELKIEEMGAAHPEHDVYAYAPVLHARLNTIGKFSDIPLVLYCERVKDTTGDTLQYTVIFSNEDGGTSTRTLMSRWGRTTDIEYVYRRSVATGQGIVQGPGHKDVEFTGQHDGSHPLLMPVTDNNMVAEAKDSPLRFRPAPVLVDLSVVSREDVMDRHPFTYVVMGKELLREGKLRPFGVAAGEKISDPRNYLFVDYSATLSDASMTVSVRTKDGRLHSSDFGRSDVAIDRSGHVRTTVELPPKTSREDIDEIAFQCRVAQPARGETVAHSGQCVLHGVAKVFQLRSDYTPLPRFWWMTQPVTMRTGAGMAYRP
ncbi:MAG TPA: hypothetical protein VER03_07350 [Bryobacteraceae bacterium]|nr:hypothetical protein [Bryobacteraceae bacterium]